MYVFLQNRNLIRNQFKSCVGNEKLTFLYQRILFECNKMSGIFSNSKNVCFSYKLNANSKSKSGPYFCQKIVIKVSWPKIGLRQKLRGNVLRLSADKSRTEQNILIFNSWKNRRRQIIRRSLWKTWKFRHLRLHGIIVIGSRQFLFSLLLIQPHVRRGELVLLLGAMTPMLL